MKNNTVEIFVENTTKINVRVDEDLVSLAAEIISQSEKIPFSLIEIVFVDEEEILRINNEHLQHDYITDIITFHYHEEGEPVEGTLFCCAPRITEQAGDFDADPDTEFVRIIIHGMLHLCGYEDSEETDKARMTQLENYYLKQLQII